VLRCFAELARFPRVHCKLGGLGMDTFGSPWLGRPERPTSEEVAATWGPFVRACIDTFGPDRCLFESNFPVDRATVDWVVLWNAFKRISAGYSPAERAELFAGTAARFYGLDLGADVRAELDRARSG
jgi:predicted TIM-barrel fold metal-dependent hydrolase